LLATTLHSCFSFSSSHPPPRSTLFPYTTLFRSHRGIGREALGERRVQRRLSPVAVVEHPCGLPGEETRGLDLGRHVGDHEVDARSEEHTSELQSLAYLVCRLLLEKKKK